MQQAIAEAAKCLSATLPNASQATLSNQRVADVPVGAICVFQNQVVGRGHNRREADADPTAHAEVLALRQAARQMRAPSHEAGKTWRLDDVTLYVTLEPCPMCAGALWLARISRLVFGAWDQRAGACGSLFDIPRDPRLNHRLQVRGGVLETECARLLAEFFATRRNQTDSP